MLDLSMSHDIAPSVPLSRFTSQVGGGSALFVDHISHAMKRLRHIFEIVLVLLVQFFLVVQFTFRAGDLARIPYRRTERAAAFKVFADNPSPENKAAFQQELNLAGRYDERQQFTRAGLVMVALLGFEGGVIYLRRNNNAKYKAVA
jgi:hypothetical protein